MITSVRRYVARRKKGFLTTAGVMGGVYIVQQYVSSRLEELKYKLEEERVARDNLRRRFRQSQEDISFTVLALMPTLSEQILTLMDVEALTQELQNRSKARHVSRRTRLPSASSPSSLASSVELVHQSETQSDTEGSIISYPGSSRDASDGVERAPEAIPDEATQKTQDSLVNGSSSSVSSGDAAPQAESRSNSVARPDTDEVSVADSTPSDSAMSSSFVSDTNSSRTAAELWNEVKILTFTRTLTTLYSTTLLTLFTLIQLTILARSKYLGSVIQLERDERFRNRLTEELSLSNVLFGGGQGIEALLSGDMNGLIQPEDDVSAFPYVPITEDAESKFLTMSWWILHVGWKDLRDRIRGAVEEVFEGVSLKSKLAVIDLHRLVTDVRRRVEQEVTYGGGERRTNFLSALLPQTPEMTHHVLVQGGYVSHQPITPYDLFEFGTSPGTMPLRLPFSVSQANSVLYPHVEDPPFAKLLAETRSTVLSPDFLHVLEVSLDRATEVLFDGLEKSVFITTEPPPTPGEAVRIRLAGLLPGLARWSHLALNGLPNELVDDLLRLRETQCLSAIIFSKFDERL